MVSVSCICLRSGVLRKGLRDNSKKLVWAGTLVFWALESCTEPVKWPVSAGLVLRREGGEGWPLFTHKGAWERLQRPFVLLEHTE